MNVTHGSNSQTEKKRHIGDLGNILAEAYGKVNISFSDPIIHLSDAYSILGLGLVIHETQGDFGLTNATTSKTLGNGGTRLEYRNIALQMTTPVTDAIAAINSTSTFAATSFGVKNFCSLVTITALMLLF